MGFIGVGSENGYFSLIDMRGPSVIYQGSVGEFTKQEKRSSFLRGPSSASAPKDWPVAIEFGVMTLEGDKFSSICCFVGTSSGKVVTFVIVPQGGGYEAKPAGFVQMDSKIVSLCPIEADTGKSACATGPAVAGLREGKQVNGLLVAGMFYRAHAQTHFFRY